MTLSSRKPGWLPLFAGVLATAVLGASYAYSAYRSELENLWV